VVVSIVWPRQSSADDSAHLLWATFSSGWVSGRCRKALGRKRSSPVTDLQAQDIQPAATGLAQDTAPTDVSGGTPSPASPVKSLFQIRCYWIEDDAMGKLGIASGRACAMAPGSDVVTWTDDDRRELRELCRVHDRMMAE